MADTAIKTEEEKKEYFDEPEVLDAKITMLAEMILASKHMTAFTGAGISTACGIPDYRSGFDTVLPTGPGCWEKLANKKKYEDKMKKEARAKGQQPKKAMTKNDLGTSIQKAYPSKTHMALVELMERNHLKYLISQNIDGLHRKSGIAPENISELHGNTNLEVCTQCSQEYMRDHRVRTAQKVHDHLTGRKCDNPACSGKLKDTIINFGESLPEVSLMMAEQHSQCADLCLAMGSSLRITPAADLPVATVENGGALVIVNLQKTPLDNIAALCIYAKCDDVITLLMKKLDYQIPKWQIKKRIQLQVSPDKKSLTLGGVDSNGAPYVLYQEIMVQGLAAKPSTFTNASKAPYRVPLPAKMPATFNIKLKCFGHYKEPDLTIKVDSAQLTEMHKTEYMAVFDAGASHKYELVLQHGPDRDLIGTAEFATSK